MEVKKKRAERRPRQMCIRARQEVAHMMEMYDCGCIPIVEDHRTNKPVGTITDRDIAVRAFTAGGGNPTEIKASDIMTTDIAHIFTE